MLIIFGMSALIFALGFMKMSFYGLGESTIHKGLGHFNIINPKEKESKGEYNLEFGISPNDLIEIKKELQVYDEEIQALMPRLDFSGIISNIEKSTIFLGQGVDPEAESTFSSVFIEVIDGKNLGLDLDNPIKNEIIMGNKLADILELKVGDTATLMTNTIDGSINAIDTVVSGIVSAGIDEIDKRLVMIPIEIAKQIIRSDKISKLVVGLYDTKMSEKITKDIGDKLKDTQYKAYFWKDLAPFYGSVVNLYTNFFTFLGGIIIIVVISSVLGSVSTSVAERTREFGMIKANGFSNMDIMLLVIIEIVILSFIAVVIAFVFTHISISIINVSGFTMSPPPGSSKGYPLLFDHVLLESVLIGLLMIILCVLACLKPSFSASRLKISDALRA